ncbi:MAG: hypothetical protein HY716_15395 [Planctomycetes bacterium]|nr:hypothetical protein [Planctomycetota bacterium]
MDVGAIRMQVRLAGAADPAFSDEITAETVPVDSHIPIDGVARYVWLRLALDDDRRIRHARKSQYSIRIGTRIRY